MGNKIYLAKDDEVVKHAAAQNLTAAKKRQARANIGAMAARGEDASWAEIQAAVDANMNGLLYPFGTQITDDWVRHNGTKYSMPWDVVHNKDNEMTLKTHFCIPDEIVFDQPEAIYYAPAGGIAAGQYYITISFNYGNGWVAGKHINFTFPEALAEGDQIVINTGTDAAIDPTNGRTWTVYAAGSTTVKMTGTTSDSDTGTELGATSSSGVGYTNGNVNAPQRVVYGYNRWSQSWYRQFLNSAAAAGAVYVQQNAWDRPPAQADTLRGFMGGLTADMLAVIKKSVVTTAINTVEGASEAAETTEDYFFLPSLSEMYINPQYAEGDEWDYYKELAEEAGVSGKFAQGGTYDVLKHYRLDAPASSAGVRLRSASRGFAYNTWHVSSSGNVSNGSAYLAYRGCPACKIRKSA